MNTLKNVHLLTGAAALLLSFIPTLRADDALPYLQQPDALYLTFCGLLNLLLAPVLPARNQLQNLVCALLVLATALQCMILLTPMARIGEQPAIVLSLLPLILATILHLAINLRETEQILTLPQDMSNRETGTVKWFNTSKGFGFISRDSGDDIFVHFRAIRGDGHRILTEGQRVEFSVTMRDKGLQAEDVIASLPRRR